MNYAKNLISLTLWYSFIEYSNKIGYSIRSMWS